MTDPERPGQSDFVLIALQLNAAQASATTPEAREEADADMSHFLRMAHAGRLDEWFASHPEYTTTTTNDEDLTRAEESIDLPSSVSTRPATGKG